MAATRLSRRPRLSARSAVTVKPLPSRVGGSNPNAVALASGANNVTGPMLSSLVRKARPLPSSMPSLSQKICGRAANRTRARLAAAAMRSPGQGCGASSRAIRPTSPESSSVMGALLAVGTSATGRPSAARNRSAITPWRSSQPLAALQPLSITRIRGPSPAIFGARPKSGSAKARISKAAAMTRSSSSHQGVCAGVCSSSFRPRSRRSGGNATWRGWGGVTRNSHHSTGRPISAASTQGAPKLNCARSPIDQASPIAACSASSAFSGE